MMNVQPSQFSLTHGVGLLLIFWLLTVACPASAQTISNGSFEEITPGAYVNGANDRMQNTAAENWTIAGPGSPDWFFAPGIDLWDTNWGNHFQHSGSNVTPAGPVGGTLADAIASSGIFREGVSQTVTGFTPGDFYDLTFNHANGFFIPPPTTVKDGGWEVFIDGISVAQVVSTNSTALPTLPFTTDWTASSVIFEAGITGTHEFTFLSYRLPVATQEPSFQWLDNVAITPVPEPSSAVIGLIGLGGLTLVRRVRASNHRG